METILLIKKFAPIFVFHSQERHFPVNLKTAKKEEFKENMFPEEPLYYAIISNKNNEVIVNYVLLFPRTYKGLFGFSSFNGDVKFVRLIIDTKKKTLKRLYYGNHLVKEYKLKTDRPRVYVSLETHNFYPTAFTERNIFGFVVEETNNGLIWETDETRVYMMKDLKGRNFGVSPYIPKNFFRIPIQ